jgi:hypothetical protein
MGLDYTTRLPAGHPMPQKELVLIAEDLLNGAGQVTCESPDYFYITLIGSNHHPLSRARVGGSVDLSRCYGDEPTPRIIEVVRDPENATLFVTTRHADTYTNAVADCFSRVVTRWWGGTRDNM